MKTCSISGAFMAENAETLVPQGLTEAQLSGAQAKGQLGVAFAKVAKGEIKKYAKIAEGTKADGTTFTITYNGQVKVGKVMKHSYDIAKLKPGGAPQFFSAGENSAFLQQIMDEATWKFGNASTPTVAAGPNPVTASVGAMSDEDVSTLFVVIKDQLAKEKGINIKGSNPELDALVHKEIGERVGYTAQEVHAKIEAYKATGKKLSALKKKALKDKPVIPKKPKPATVPDEVKTQQATFPKANADQVKYFQEKFNDPAALEEIKGFASNKGGDVPLWKQHSAQKALSDKGYDFKVSVEPDPYPLAQAKYVDMYKEDLDSKDPIEIQFIKSVASNDKGDVPKSLQQSAQKALKDKGLDWSAEPNGVPTQATADLVDDVVEAIDDKGLMHKAYTAEDKAAQYVMAKDKVVADSAGKWTLYSQDPDMELAIYDMIQSITGLSMHDVKVGVQEYLASGKKLSVLKKQLIKNGSMKKAAPTLKGGTKATKANVKAFADKGFTPKDSTPVNLEMNLMNGQLESMFTKFKQHGAIYLDKPAQQLYDSAWQVAKEINDSKWIPDAEVSVLDVIRFIDSWGTKKGGFSTNAHMYEQKIVPWAGSPQGKAFIQAKMDAQKLIDNMPPLPTDSNTFQVISTEQARAMQDRLPRWSADEKAGLTHYTGGSYSAMNQYLRGKTTYISTTNKNAITNAKSGMRAVDQSFLVRRGTSFHQFDVNSHEEVAAMVGKTVADKGFLSTSVGGDAAFGGSVKMEVEVAKGTKGAYVDHISMHRGEREFIIAPGTKMKILRVEQHGYQTVVRLRTIP